MKVVFSADHRLQNPRSEIHLGTPIPTFERAARAENIRSELMKDSRFLFVDPFEHGRHPIERVHRAGMVDFLERAWIDMHDETDRDEFVPEVMLHAGLRENMPSVSPPRSASSAFGYWCYETATPIVSGTYRAARASVDVALTAGDIVLAGERSAYALCRPPGHHAARAVFGGFCYFNNAAIVADHLVRATGSKVAILDVDYHHGNGTQHIFYERDDVFFTSLHGDPTRAYPWFTGFPDETGAGRGKNTNYNVPLPAETSDETYLRRLDDACSKITRFGADILVVSLGVDTFWNDPISDFSLTTEGYAKCAELVRDSGLPMVVVQEGGYDIDAIGVNVRSWLTPLVQ